LDKNKAKCAVVGGKQLLAVIEDRRGGGAWRQVCQPEGIVAQLRDFGWGHRGGELFARRVKRVRQIGCGQAVRELAEDFRWLIEPEVSDEFRGLRRVLEPRRLPGDRSDEIRALRKRLGNPPSGGVSGLGGGGLHCDDEF